MIKDSGVDQGLINDVELNKNDTSIKSFEEEFFMIFSDQMYFSPL